MPKYVHPLHVIDVLSLRITRDCHFQIIVVPKKEYDSWRAYRDTWPDKLQICTDLLAQDESIFPDVRPTEGEVFMREYVRTPDQEVGVGRDTSLERREARGGDCEGAGEGDMDGDEAPEASSEPPEEGGEF